MNVGPTELIILCVGGICIITLAITIGVVALFVARRKN